MSLRPKETRAVWLLTNTLLFFTSEDIGAVGRKKKSCDRHASCIEGAWLGHLMFCLVN